MIAIFYAENCQDRSGIFFQPSRKIDGCICHDRHGCQIDDAGSIRLLGEASCRVLRVWIPHEINRAIALDGKINGDVRGDRGIWWSKAGGVCSRSSDRLTALPRRGSWQTKVNLLYFFLIFQITLVTFLESTTCRGTKK